MLSVEEARARILAGLRPTPAEIVALAEAWGRVLADAGGRPADPAAARRVGDGRLRAARRRWRCWARRCAWSAARPPGIRSPAGRRPARRCACSPAASCRRAPTPILLQEDATRDGDRVRGQRGGGRRPPYPPRRPGFRAGRRVVPRRPAADRARCRPGRRRQPSLAHRASPPARRDPGHRRRDRHAGGADPARAASSVPTPTRWPRWCAAGGGEPMRAADRARRPRRDRRRGRAGRRGWTCWSPPAAPASATTIWCSPALGDARAGAGFLADRDAAGQAADVRPARRGAGAGPAGQPGVGHGVRRRCSCCRRWRGCPACPPTRPHGRRRVLGAALAANDHRADHLRATPGRRDEAGADRDAVPRQDSAHAAARWPSPMR